VGEEASTPVELWEAALVRDCFEKRALKELVLPLMLPREREELDRGILLPSFFRNPCTQTAIKQAAVA